jgi:histidine triad (HIT) family protein/ATP adenylyltransferase
VDPQDDGARAQRTREEIVADDAEHVTFLGKYPTMYGHVLVAPLS